jgi:2-polyprenyl-3-methyl-5-hydroxy-6-metoxy-1,4-benzoquinol methylase
MFRKHRTRRALERTYTTPVDEAFAVLLQHFSEPVAAWEMFAGREQQLIACWHRLERAIKRAAYEVARPSYDLHWLETAASAQSLAFMTDILPTFHSYTRKYPSGAHLRVLDVGCGPAAGSHLLAAMHSSSFLGFEATVDAVDILAVYDRYIRVAFSRVNHLVTDLSTLDPGRVWDFVISSHAIEYVDDPDAFLGALRRRATDKVLVYGPLEEDMASADMGHVNRLDERFFAPYRPVEVKKIRSVGWRKSTSPDDPTECILAVLPGLAPAGS